MSKFSCPTVLQHEERGASAVEAALLVPLVVVLLMGIVQYGYIFASYITVRNATAAGARHAVLDGASDAQVVTAAGNALEPMLSQSDIAAVNYDGSFPVSGTNYHRVEIVYNLRLFLPYVVPGANSDGTFRLTAATLML